MILHKLIQRALLWLAVSLLLASLTLSFPLRAQEPRGEHTPLIHDALIRPSLPGELTLQQMGGAPDYYQTSEYMAGRVAVGIFLPESNGAIDTSTEDWADSQIAQVEAEIAGALDWWTQALPGADLSFAYELHARVPTSYEPITHPQRDEGLWIAETLASLGYGGSNYFMQAYAYLNELRQSHHADWAFAIFVVNSAADADNMFDDCYFAYAYIGGPFAVLTYDNDGYGICNMDAILAHEMGHVFGALDQYPGAHVPCTARSGYLDIPNYNSQYGSCPANVPSIMRGGTTPYHQHAIDLYAKGQVGHWDSDGDGLPDPLDTVPSLALPSASPDGEGQVSYTGTAEDVAWPAPNHADATINTIVSVQYRMDGGPWDSASPGDGHFDSFSEPFAFTVAPGGGSHIIEARAVNSAGNVSEIASDEVLIEDSPTDTPTSTNTPIATSTPTPTRTQTPSPTPTHTPQPPTPTSTATASPTPDSNVSVLINDGLKYTNHTTVTLRIQAPAKAVEMEVSNDPGFSSAAHLLVAPTVTWTLDKAQTGGLRTVYVRFSDSDGNYFATGEDSITLDIQPPTGSISASPQGKGVLLLHLPASDDLSGVQQMSFSSNEQPQADDWISYQPTYEIRDQGTAAFYVRYRDAAGNVSATYTEVNPARLKFKAYFPIAPWATSID